MALGVGADEFFGELFNAKQKNEDPKGDKVENNGQYGNQEETQPGNKWNTEIENVFETLQNVSNGLGFVLKNKSNFLQSFNSVCH